ncbi:hypothetical protein FQA47_002143 [Oryzias melastigma]|uniref:Uncharacterized protein n=1 Tax=Oryzias melastigma TaxID=30732 RepID=A0A834F529_ORYME|nr:hypothetical protein FQA47_002143 [Oryzias melastigma]
MPESVLSKTSTSTPAKISSGTDGAFLFSFGLMELPECISKDFADVVAVLISLIVSDDLEKKKKKNWSSCNVQLLFCPSHRLRGRVLMSGSRHCGTWRKVSVNTVDHLT